MGRDDRGGASDGSDWPAIDHDRGEPSRMGEYTLQCEGARDLSSRKETNGAAFRSEQATFVKDGINDFIATAGPRR